MTDIGSVSGNIVMGDQFSGNMSKFNKGLGVAKKGMAAAAIGAAAVGAAMVVAANKVLAFADALDNQANMTHASVESLQVFNAAAERAGLSATAVTTGMQRLARNISDGTIVAIDAFNMLGLSIDDLADLPVEESFKLVLKSLDGIENQADKTATAMALLGKAGAGFLSLGGEGLNDFEKEMREMNIVLDKETIRAVDKLEQEIDLLSRGLQAATHWIGAALVRSEGFVTIVELLKSNVGDLNKELSNEEGLQSWGDEVLTTATDNMRIFILLSNEMIGMAQKVGAAFELMQKSPWEALTDDTDDYDELLNQFNTIDQTTRTTALSIQEGFQAAKDRAAEAAAALRDAAGVVETTGNKTGDFAEKQALLNEMMAAGVEMLGGNIEANIAWGENTTNTLDTVVAKWDEANVSIPTASMNMTNMTEQAFARMGINTRAELEATLHAAERDYNLILESGDATADGLMQAEQKLADLRAQLSMENVEQAQIGFNDVMSAASAALGTLASKNKAAAIGVAIIDGILAVQKAWASLPLPFNIPIVAATVAATAINVSKIRSTDVSGFRGGTPDFDFQDFGNATSTVLHGPEAVVTKGTGSHALAGEIVDSMGKRGGGGGGDTILMLDGMVLAKWLEKNTKAGRTRIHPSSVRDF